MSFDKSRLNFEKNNGLIPAIVQDAQTRQVLMMGYMNEAALDKTLEEGKVTFFSRSKGRLWTKGETSEHYLDLVSIQADCDQDTLLVKVRPHGPVCHEGTDTCWGEENKSDNFLQQLEDTINQRKSADPQNSYTASLLAKGINKVAQKVGEEAVELVIEAKDDNEVLFLNEAADLMYHYIVLLAAKGYQMEDVIGVLKERHQ
jgi:phosphoribosyl-ATP pyrophosphohydrolase/phosphoribosyl-AMP cyclohydrolase